ncbi:hypothetical protein ACIBG0_38910 [Nocardia sp. NPDC050630]|uniref:hypothetical protein n=1 Tax=Nocardia sp. NPDC050630 TaxID=3364321 RepID=UPI00379AFB0E
MSDQAFIAGIAQAFADATGARHSQRCGTEGCHWAIHAGDELKAQSEYEKHLRTDPRHTGQEWIDRDGYLRRGLTEVIGKA